MTAISRATPKRQAPRLFHPLCGSDVRTLVRLLSSNGPVAPGHRTQIAIVVGAVLARLPFTTLERLAVAGMMRRTPAMPAPIFIVGHWRSGTTHLYNLLSKDPAFAYVPPLATGLPWDMFGIAAALRPLLERALPETRFIDNVRVDPDSPQEDEIALANMTPLSFYHGIYFPRNFEAQFNRGVFFDGCSEREIAAWQRTFIYFLRKIAIQQPGRRLLIKNPVYTTRIDMLRKIWPEAKFIHIHRNPHDVFRSTRNFYDKLFAELALQNYRHVDIDSLILGTYPRLMDGLLQQSAGLTDSSFAEIRFEDLERDPIAVVATLYDRLGLPGFEAVQPRIAAYLTSIEGYRKNRYEAPPALRRRLLREWAPYFERWHYDTEAGGAA